MHASKTAFGPGRASGGPEAPSPQFSFYYRHCQVGEECSAELRNSSFGKLIFPRVNTGALVPEADSPQLLESSAQEQNSDVSLQRGLEILCPPHVSHGLRAKAALHLRFEVGNNSGKPTYAAASHLNGTNRRSVQFPPPAPGFARRPRMHFKTSDHAATCHSKCTGRSSIQFAPVDDLPVVSL
jgi:hypothetical protein